MDIMKPDSMNKGMLGDVVIWDSHGEQSVKSYLIWSF